MEKMVKETDESSKEHEVDRAYFIVWDLTPVQFADSMGLHLLENTIFCARCMFGFAMEVWIFKHVISSSHPDSRNWKA